MATLDRKGIKVYKGFFFAVPKPQECRRLKLTSKVTSIEKTSQEENKMSRTLIVVGLKLYYLLLFLHSLATYIVYCIYQMYEYWCYLFVVLCAVC